MFKDNNFIYYQQDVNIKFIKISERKKKNIFPYDPFIDYNKLLITNVCEYSITKETVANKILKIMKNFTYPEDIITDATAGSGSMGYYFSKYYKNVKLVEPEIKHQQVIKNNLEIYKVDNYKLYPKDYLSIMNRLTQDVVFFDPPWGGKNYKKLNSLSLYLDNINILCIISELLKKEKCRIIFLFAPKNFNLDNSKLKNIYFHKYYIDKFLLLSFRLNKKYLG